MRADTQQPQRLNHNHFFVLYLMGYFRGLLRMLDKLFLCYSFVLSVKILKSDFILFVFLKLVATMIYCLLEERTIAL